MASDSPRDHFKPLNISIVLRSRLAWEDSLERTPTTNELLAIPIDDHAPLLVVDVDEVLAMFMRAFETFVSARGFELRFDRYALFANLYRPGAMTCVDIGLGRELFDDFFRHAVEDIDPAPGAAVAERREKSAAPRCT